MLKPNLPQSLPMIRALQHTYGVGRAIALQVCAYLGVHPRLPIGLLTPEHTQGLEILEKTVYPTSFAVRETQKDAIQSLISTSTYRGIRHVRKLPVRGQKSKTNAKTVKKMRAPIKKKRS